MKAYKILTFLITILGRLRYKVVYRVGMRLLKDSPLIKDEMPFRHLTSGSGVLIECCDCGLEHRFFKEGKILQAQPLRPKGYDYSWRLKDG